MAYKQQKFIAHSFGGWKFEIRVPAWWGQGPLPGDILFLYPHMVERARGSGIASLVKSLIPFMSSLHESSSKAPPSNTVILSVRISIYKFWNLSIHPLLSFFFFLYPSLIFYILVLNKWCFLTDRIFPSLQLLFWHPSHLQLKQLVVLSSVSHWKIVTRSKEQPKSVFLFLA